MITEYKIRSHSIVDKHPINLSETNKPQLKSVEERALLCSKLRAVEPFETSRITIIMTIDIQPSLGSLSMAIRYLFSEVRRTRKNAYF